jgi:hypothetical protein
MTLKPSSAPEDRSSRKLDWRWPAACIVGAAVAVTAVECDTGDHFQQSSGFSLDSPLVEPSSDDPNRHRGFFGRRIVTRFLDEEDEETTQKEATEELVTCVKTHAGGLIAVETVGAQASTLDYAPQQVLFTSYAEDGTPRAYAVGFMGEVCTDTDFPSFECHGTGYSTVFVSGQQAADIVQREEMLKRHGESPYKDAWFETYPFYDFQGDAEENPNGKSEFIISRPFNSMQEVAESEKGSGSLCGNLVTALDNPSVWDEVAEHQTRNYAEGIDIVWDVFQPEDVYGWHTEPYHFFGYKEPNFNFGSDQTVSIIFDDTRLNLDTVIPGPDDEAEPAFIFNYGPCYDRATFDEFASDPDIGWDWADCLEEIRGN